MKRIFNILILIFGISFIWIVTSGIINVNCLFKSLFDFRCPGCGLTRSFREVFNLDFYSAFNYNILGIPLFIIVIIVLISMIFDIIRNDNKTIIYILNFLRKHYIIIIILLIITTIINNINGI